jgi:hypothetical protein
MVLCDLQGIIQHIIFPLMCHNEEDEELWQSDPVEYIRLKYGTIFILYDCWHSGLVYGTQGYINMVSLNDL